MRKATTPRFPPKGATILASASAPFPSARRWWPSCWRTITSATAGRLVRARPPSAHEVGDDLDMRREEELIDRHDAGDAVAAIHQNAEVARQRARVAGDRDELRHLRFCKLLRLRR